MDNFLSLSRYYGSDFFYIQGPGGNTSEKLLHSQMLIKPSGELLANLSRRQQYASVSTEAIKAFFANSLVCEKDPRLDEDLVSLIDSCTLNAKKKASIETAMHIFLSKYVFHTHPIWLNIILCSIDSKKIISNLFEKYLDYSYISFATPGYYLAKTIYEASLKNNPMENILFLENHGLIIHSNSLSEIKALHNKVEERVLDFLKDFSCDKILMKLIPFKFIRVTQDRHLFPDTVVFSQKQYDDISDMDIKNDTKCIFEAHNLILKGISMIASKPRHLSFDDVNYILSMSREKYRKQMFTK